MDKKNLQSAKQSCDIIQQAVKNSLGELSGITKYNFNSKRRNVRAFMDIYIKHLNKLKEINVESPDARDNIAAEIQRMQELDARVKSWQITNYKEIAGLLQELFEKINEEIKLVLPAIKEKLAA